MEQEQLERMQAEGQSPAGFYEGKMAAGEGDSYRPPSGQRPPSGEYGGGSEQGRGAGGMPSGEEVMELEHVIGYTGHELKTLQYYPAQQNTIVYAMGATIVIADLTDPHQQDFLRGHDNEISALAISNDGALVASGQRGSMLHKGHDAPVIVWDFKGRRDVYQLLGITHSVANLCFSSDGRFLAASGGHKNALFIWDMQTGEVVVSKGHLQEVTSLAWGPIDTSGRRPAYMLILATDNQVFVNRLEYTVASMAYVMTAEKCQLPASGLVRDYTAALVRYDEQSQTNMLVAGTSVSDMCVFNIDMKVYRASVGISTGGVISICATEDFLFCGSGDGTIKKMRGYDQRWTLEGEVQLEGKIVSMSVSPDGIDILTGTDKGKMYRVLVQDMSFVEVASSQISPIVGVSFTPTRSDVFATLSKRGVMFVRDLSDYTVICSGVPSTTRGAGKCITFTAENELLTGWESGSVECNSARDGSSMWFIALAHKGGVNTIADCRGKYIVTGGEDRCVRIWSTKMGTEMICQFAEHHKGVSKVLVDREKDHIIHSCGYGRAALTYDLKKERRTVIHQLSGSTDGAFTCMAQRTDSELELVTVGSNGSILFWDPDVDKPVQNILDPNRMRLTCVSMSPSGRFIAVCGDDHQTKVYEIASESLVAVGIGHSNTVRSLSWSPDERQIVSVGDDCCCCVWNFYGLDQ